MKLLITTLICFFAAFQSSNAQVVKSEWDNTSWTDGITEYKAKVLNSSQVLMIGSGEAVNQPIVNLVVKIGGNSRQYAVLLDPPKMTPSASQVK
ncbi:MAG: hypothetical protein IKO36_04080, partial [Bacteroidaceae bacterium]|nr:hypothetical protein [Bacteroidaceae bacterium]